MMAAYGGHAPVVTLLLDAEADVELTDNVRANKTDIMIIQSNNDSLIHCTLPYNIISDNVTSHHCCYQST